MSEIHVANVRQCVEREGRERERGGGGGGGVERWSLCLAAERQKEILLFCT